MFLQLLTAVCIQNMFRSRPRLNHTLSWSEFVGRLGGTKIIGEVSQANLSAMKTVTVPGAMFPGFETPQNPV
jgi:hypothetical protein